MFTPDNTTLFIAVQHPGEGGTFDEPVSTWPDGKAPARASVIVIQAEDGAPLDALLVLLLQQASHYKPLSPASYMPIC